MKKETETNEVTRNFKIAVGLFLNGTKRVRGDKYINAALQSIRGFKSMTFQKKYSNGIVIKTYFRNARGTYDVAITANGSQTRVFHAFNNGVDMIKYLSNLKGWEITGMRYRAV